MYIVTLLDRSVMLVFYKLNIEMDFYLMFRIYYIHVLNIHTS